MPDLDTLLKDTMLLAAAPRAPFTSFGGDSADTEAAATPSTGARWSWTHSPANAGQVTDLTYQLPETPWYRAQTATVLDELVWHPLELSYRGTAMTLELSQKYLLRKYEASEGWIAADQSRYWIAADIDQSLLLVFGFQVSLRGASGGMTLEPIPRDVLDRDDFMPVMNASEPPAPPPAMTVKSAETGTLQLVPLRVLVCAELVCCQERADYAPGAIASTSRFRPHLMLMSNRTLERMDARISIRRPAMSSMAHSEGLASARGPHDMAEPPSGNPDDVDEMSHEMVAGMWSDSNSSVTDWQKIADMTFPPLWSSIFSRVKTNLPAGSAYLMASPELEGGPGFNAYIWTGTEYRAHQQELMPRQGYFDNLHMAPTMMAPRSLRKLYESQPQFKLDAIVMAPFCIHDCLHIHWRWYPASEKNVWGWGVEGPYSIPGAPQIPVNQHLRVELESTHAFAYCVHADTGLEAGRWQYILHEGLAYGNNTTSEWNARMMLLGAQLLDDWPRTAVNSWAMFYWFLRYWHWHEKGALQDRLLEDGAPVP